jgi:hypothetical protein
VGVLAGVPAEPRVWRGGARRDGAGENLATCVVAFISLGQLLRKEQKKGPVRSVKIGTRHSTCTKGRGVYLYFGAGAIKEVLNDIVMCVGTAEIRG